LQGCKWQLIKVSVNATAKFIRKFQNMVKT